MKADPDAPAQATGRPPISFYAKCGNCTAVESLLRNNASADPPGYLRGRTPLMEAAIEGHAKVLQILVKHNADVGRVDEDGKTAKDWAYACEKNVDYDRAVAYFHAAREQAQQE